MPKKKRKNQKEKLKLKLQKLEKVLKEKSIKELDQREI